MVTENNWSFDQTDIAERLATVDDAALDVLQFGIIGFDEQTVVQRYNTFESQLAGLNKSRVLGHPFFTSVAPCMNNFLVAQRFEDALATGDPLDATLDYVLTLRMKPVKVKLRLLAGSTGAMRYVLILRPLPV